MEKNFKVVEEFLSKYKSSCNLDIVLLPEMAFTGKK